MRSLWLMVTSDAARHKAFNFLKLIKPPDGSEMTDQTIKLDWNKETGNQWQIGGGSENPDNAKLSMEAAGFDWEKRDGGLPLGEDNFRVVYATTRTQALSYGREIEVSAGDPVRHFELLEQWMGPALAVSDPNDPREGFHYKGWPAGSLYDKFPPAETYNSMEWVNVWVFDPLESSEYWFRTVVQKIKDTAANNSKVSQNGNANSTWYQWTSAQDPDLGADEIWLFESNGDGGFSPLAERSTVAA